MKKGPETMPFPVEVKGHSNAKRRFRSESGIIGEYIGKIYTEAKRRPRYFIMEKTNALEII